MRPRELGEHAEIAVADYLFAAGFDVLWRNLRVGSLELDVVARRGPLAVAVEVRTRKPGALVGPFQSVGRTKRKRVLEATRRLWDRHLRRMPDIQRLRIDVAAVTFDRGETRVTYAEGALSG
jgi:putative endonuclease